MTTTSNPQSLRTRDVGRAAYFSIGVTLFMLKFLIDWSVAHLIFDRKWSPAEYVAPGASIALLFTEAHARTFYTTMLIVALPFIAVGVWLTAMRLRSVGITPGWRVLFFVPGINFAMFALLSVLPRRQKIPLAALASTSIPPVPHSGAAPPLDYALGIESPDTWLDRMMPAKAPQAWAVAVVVPAIIGLAATYLSVQLFHEHGWGGFVGLPFAIGFIAALLYAPRSARGTEGCISAACVAVTIYGGIMLLFALEGIGCMVMAAPFAQPIAIIGAMIGSSLRARPTRLADTRRVMWVMLLFLPMFIGAEK